MFSTVYPQNSDVVNDAVTFHEVCSLEFIQNRLFCEIRVLLGLYIKNYIYIIFYINVFLL